MKTSHRLPGLRMNRIYRDMIFLFMASLVVAATLVTLGFALLQCRG